MHQYQKKQEMIAIATSDEAKKVYENHMKANDPKALTEDKLKTNKAKPVGLDAFVSQALGDGSG